MHFRGIRFLPLCTSASLYFLTFTPIPSLLRKTPSLPHSTLYSLTLPLPFCSPPTHTYTLRPVWLTSPLTAMILPLHSLLPHFFLSYLPVPPLFLSFPHCFPPLHFLPSPISSCVLSLSSLAYPVLPHRPNDLPPHPTHLPAVTLRLVTNIISRVMTRSSWVTLQVSLQSIGAEQCLCERAPLFLCACPCVSLQCWNEQRWIKERRKYSVWKSLVVRHIQSWALSITLPPPRRGRRCQHSSALRCRLGALLFFILFI